MQGNCLTTEIEGESVTPTEFLKGTLSLLLCRTPLFQSTSKRRPLELFTCGFKWNWIRQKRSHLFSFDIFNKFFYYNIVHHHRKYFINCCNNINELKENKTGFRHFSVPSNMAKSSISKFNFQCYAIIRFINENFLLVLFIMIWNL